MRAKQLGKHPDPKSLSKTVSCCVTRERRAQIIKLAELKETTISAILNSAIDLYLAKHNEL